MELETVSIPKPLQNWQHALNHYRNCLSSGINILAGGGRFPQKSWLQVTYPLLKAASFDTFAS